MRNVRWMIGLVLALAALVVGQAAEATHVTVLVEHEGYLQRADDGTGPTCAWYLADELGSYLAETAIRVDVFEQGDVDCSTPGHQDLVDARLGEYRGLWVRVEGYLDEIDPHHDPNAPFIIDTISLLPDPAPAIRADLAARGVDYFGTGTPQPRNGLTRSGICDDGTMAARVEIALPPPNSADFFTDIGWICPRTRRYWVLRAGGIAGLSTWVGPFALPDAHIYRARIENDLATRGVDFGRDGADEPLGIAVTGECGNGFAETLNLGDTPGEQDTLRDDAYVCDDSYWARRRDIADGSVDWVGPFPVPAGFTVPPESMRPSSLRSRNRRRNRVRVKLVLPEVYTFAANTPIRPSDLDFGPGIQVLKVREVNIRTVRVKLRVDRGLAPGLRDLGIFDLTVPDFFEVRGPRNRAVPAR